MSGVPHCVEPGLELLTDLGAAWVFGDVLVLGRVFFGDRIARHLAARRGHLEVRMLAPEPMLTQLPSMIAPENDNRIVGNPQLLQFVEQSADLHIDKTDARMVAANQFARRCVRNRSLFRNATVGSHLASCVFERLWQVVRKEQVVGSRCSSRWSCSLLINVARESFPGMDDVDPSETISIAV